MYTLTHTTTELLQKKQRAENLKRSICDLIDTADSWSCDMRCGTQGEWIREGHSPVHMEFLPNGETTVTLKTKHNKLTKVKT